MEHEINDRERRCLRRAMLKEEAEKRKRLLDEQRLLQSQRDEYIMNVRRKREEANRQEYLLGLARADEARRRSDEQRRIEGYRQEEERLKRQREQFLSEEKRRREEMITRLNGDQKAEKEQKDGSLMQERPRGETKVSSNAQKEKEEVHTERTRSDDYRLEQMRLRKQFPQEQTKYQSPETQGEYRKTGELEYLLSLDETDDQLYDIENESWKMLSSTGYKDKNTKHREESIKINTGERTEMFTPLSNLAQKGAIPKIPTMEGSRQRIEEDKSRKDKLFKNAGDTEKVSEPLYTIEEEIAALDRRLTLLSQERYSPSLRENTELDKRTGLDINKAKEGKKLTIDESYVKGVSERLTSKDGSDLLPKYKAISIGAKREERDRYQEQVLDPVLSSMLNETDLPSEIDSYEKSLYDQYALPREDKLTERNRLQPKRKLKFDESILQRPVLEGELTEWDRGKDSRQLLGVPFVETNRLPYGDKQIYVRDWNTKAESKFDDPARYDITRLLEDAFTQGFRRALESDSLPRVSEALPKSQDIRSYVCSSYVKDECAIGSMGKQSTQPGQEVKFETESCPRIDVHNVEAGGLKNEIDISFNPSTAERHRQKEAMLKAKEEELNRAELELNKMEWAIQQQEETRAKAAKPDPYAEHLAVREKELNERYEKIQNRKQELQRREAALWQKQPTVNETISSSTKQTDTDIISDSKLNKSVETEMKGKTDHSRNIHQQEPVEKLSEKRNYQQIKATMTEDSKITESNTIETKSTNIEQVSFPKITAFSGEDPKPKTEASFEEWKYEVNCLRQDGSYKQSQVALAVRKSLRAQAKRVLLQLGPSAEVKEIMSKLEGVFGNVATGESILAEFYTATQRQDESVAAWGLRLEEILQKAMEKGQIKQDEKNDMLREKFWRALRSDRLRNATRVHFESVSNFELLRRAVRAEEHQMNLYSGIKQQQMKVEVKNAESKEEDSKYNQLLSRISSLEKQLKNTEKQRWYGRNRYTPQNKNQEQKQTEEPGDQKKDKLNQ